MRDPIVVLIAAPNASMLEPSIAPPLGLAYLAGHARQAGWDISQWKIIDLNVEATAGPNGPKGHWYMDFSLDRCMSLIPSGADVYILKNVLHGYDDCSALRVLQHCHAAMQSEARLLVIETVVPDRIDSSDPRVEEMLMSDLNMLAVTGGRERSATEWTELLARAGIELQRIASVDDSSICIIEAVSSES